MEGSLQEARLSPVEVTAAEHKRCSRGSEHEAAQDMLREGAAMAALSLEDLQDWGKPLG